MAIVTDLLARDTDQSQRLNTRFVGAGHRHTDYYSISISLATCTAG